MEGGDAETTSNLATPSEGLAAISWFTPHDIVIDIAQAPHWPTAHVEAIIEILPVDPGGGVGSSNRAKWSYLGAESMVNSLRPQAEVKNIQVVGASGTIAMSVCAFTHSFSFRPTQEDVDRSKRKVPNITWLCIPDNKHRCALCYMQ